MPAKRNGALLLCVVAVALALAALAVGATFMLTAVDARFGAALVVVGSVAFLAAVWATTVQALDRA